MLGAGYVRDYVSECRSTIGDARHTGRW